MGRTRKTPKYDYKAPMPVKVHEFEMGKNRKCLKCGSSYRHMRHWHSFKKSIFAITRGSGTRCECGLPMSSERHVWKGGQDG